MVNKAIRSLFQQNGTIIKCNESKNYWKYTETAPNSGNRKAIQDGFFRGCLRMGSDGSYKNETFYRYALPKEDLKNVNQVTHPLGPADINNFSPKICNFCYINKDRYK